MVVLFHLGPFEIVVVHDLLLFGSILQNFCTTAFEILSRGEDFGKFLGKSILNRCENYWKTDFQLLLQMFMIMTWLLKWKMK